MAKRHKGEDAEPEEEYQFVPPEFDEDQFIHKEMVSFHTTVTLFFVGVVAALISWGIFAAVDGARSGWLYGIVIVAVAFAALRIIFRVLKIDIGHWGRREWLGTAFLLFFAWLAFFIMFVNPPISDFAPPETDIYVSPGAAAQGDDVVFDMFFADNDRVKGRTFLVTGPDGFMADSMAMQHVDGAHYRYVLQNATAGTYVWSASATDATGHRSTANGTVAVQPDVLTVIAGDLTTPTATVFVRVPEAVNVYAVYAQLTTGERVYFEYKEDLGGYQASQNYEGWQEGTNTFDIIVEERNRFHAQTLIPGGIIKDGPHTIEVTDPGEYNKGQPSRGNPTQAPAVNVPGLEVVPILGALLVGAFLVRRRLF